MFARLMIASLFSLVLGNEALAEGRDDAPLTATKYAMNTSGQTTAFNARTAFAGNVAFLSVQDGSASQSALSGYNAMSAFQSHLYRSHQLSLGSHWDASLDGRSRLMAIDPDDLKSPAGLVEVFIDDWQIGQYKSFSFHLKADDIVGLEIKSKFSF